MNDPGKTHSIYDGLTLRQVIALHQQALGELAMSEQVREQLRTALLDPRLSSLQGDLVEAKVTLVQREAQLAALVAEIWGIAAESILPDGDGVTVPVALWAESVLERFSALAAEHDLALRADSYEAGQAAEKAAQQATYWADQKMPREPTFSDRETP